MIAFPLFLVFGALTIWGFFNTGIAGWIFMGTATLFASWLLLTSWSLRSTRISGLAPDALTKAEAETFRRYSLYFIYPFQAKQYSGIFSLIQALCLIWIAVCAWRQEWILLSCFVAMFLVATNMAPFLNQGNFLRHHEARGKLSPELLDRLELVQAIESKILEARTGGRI